MMGPSSLVGAFVGLQAVLSPPVADAAECPTVLKPTGYGAPVVAGGWTAQLIANGLQRPRSLQFDGSGNLLILEMGKGVSRMTFTDNGGTCLVKKGYQVVVPFSELNHGIALSNDNKTLYASSADAVYSWPYDSSTGTAGSDQKKLIQGMTNTDHVTRTLLISQKVPGTLLVSRGSADNIDDLARQESSGHSQLRSFSNLGAITTPLDFSSSGTLLGWGLRNSVGVAEEPLTGGIYTVENSADQLQRDGVDIHQDNPGEELNFHGYLNGTTAGVQGGNYGYPDCYALWDTGNVPNLAGNMTVGNQFPLAQSGSLNDNICNSNYIPPRITFQAHMAPLDIKFTADGSEAYVSFHGSWNRNAPIGYKLSALSFSSGFPVDPPTSTTAVKDILSNADLSACPGSCFRPCGLAVDGAGRLYMTSDSTGEIYVLRRTGDFTAVSGGGGGTLVTSTESSTASKLFVPGAVRLSREAWNGALVLLVGVLPGLLLLVAMGV